MTMVNNFPQCFELLLGNEGGYSNNSSDPGGETMWGVTARVARKWGYKGEMRALPKTTAMEIAREEYWLPYHCDLFPAAIAFQLFDTVYNGGYPVKWLQSIANTTAVGSGLASALSVMNVWEVVAKFNALRLSYLASLKQPQFANGRMNRVSSNIIHGGSLKDAT